MNRFVTRIDGLEKRGLLERNIIGNFYQTTPHNPVHDANVLGEASAGGRKAGCASYLLVDLTLREGLLAAVVALTARNVVVRHHAIANRKAADAFSHANNRARHLMPEDARRIMRASVNLLQVRPADPAGVDLDQHLACADLRHRNRFDTDIIYAAIHRGAHRVRDLLASLVLIAFRHFKYSVCTSLTGSPVSVVSARIASLLFPASCK